MTTTKVKEVGVTGGIGAGKSLVCRIFSLLGVPVYPADERAKWLMANDSVLRSKIIDHFGPGAYDHNQLNRQYLAKHVFSDAEKLNLLNSLVHPAVNEDYLAWVKTIEYPYCIKEAALLFETGSFKKLDCTILVSAPAKVRVQRVLKRDPFRKEEEIIAIIGKQMDEDRKKELADLVVVNDGERMIVPDILEIHESIKGSNVPKDMGHGQGK